jgi:hypothetical protein
MQNANIKIFHCVFLVLIIQILISILSYHISKKYKLFHLLKKKNNSFPKLILFFIIVLIIESFLITYIMSDFEQNNKTEFLKRFSIFVLISLFNGFLLSLYDNEKKARNVIIQLFILWSSCFLLSFYLSFTNKLNIKKIRLYYFIMFTIIFILELCYILFFYKLNKTFNIIFIILSLISTLLSTDDLLKKKLNCINGSFQFYTEIINLFQRLYEIN